MPNDLTFTITSTVTAVPFQDITLTVAPSANFSATRYLYQWAQGGVNIGGAITSSYKFDASTTPGHTSFSCAVSGLSGANGSTFVYSETTPNMIVTVIGDTSIFARHLPKGANQLKESGFERFRRIRNMGYC